MSQWFVSMQYGVQCCSLTNVAQNIFFCVHKKVIQFCKDMIYFYLFKCFNLEYCKSIMSDVNVLCYSKCILKTYV